MARVSRLADVSAHCARVALLVHSLRHERFIAAGGAPHAFRAQLLPSMRDMGLDLRADDKPNTSLDSPKSKSTARASEVPSLGQKRRSMFADSPTAVNVRSTSPPGKQSKLTQNRRVHPTISHPSAPHSPKSRQLRPPAFDFLKSLGDDKLKSQCGMMRFLWEDDSVLRGDTPLSEHIPIHARFKQFYFDFIVEEIPSTVLDASVLPVPLPRRKADRNFAVPPIPTEFMDLLGMQTTHDNLFAPVDVSSQMGSAMSLRELKRRNASEAEAGDAHSSHDLPGAYSGIAESIARGGQRSSLSPPAVEGGVERRRLYVQAVMRKRRLPHAVAMQRIAHALGVRPSKVSFAGIKDYVADTVQHIRVEGVSPQQMLDANIYFRKNNIRISLSDFSYHYEPLITGYLTGNRFEITLRDVSERDVARLTQNVSRVSTTGCLNYFGSQRFSSFAGREDPTLAIIKGNWLLFVFRFLNYTDNPKISLTQLLQRPLVYPTLGQNVFRHAAVRRLKQLRIEPTVLDGVPAFKQTPKDSDDDPFSTDVMSMNGAPGRGQFSKPRIAFAALKSAYFDVPETERSISTQMLMSYYWNMLVSARYNYCGTKVLVGDIVDMLRVRSDAAAKALPNTVDAEGSASAERYGMVTKENAHLFTIEDVVLPTFSLHNAMLPKNRTSDIYHDICSHHGLSWEQRVPALQSQMRSTQRPMLVKPRNVSLRLEKASEKTIASRSPTDECDGDRYDAVLSFDLPKGSYASVVLSDILSLPHCTGMDKTRLRPRPYATEWNMGRKDKRHVRTMESLYSDAQGSGLSVDVESSSASDAPANSEAARFELPLSAAQDSADAYRHATRDVSEDIAEWSSYHLVRNGVRNVQVDEERRSLLFEKAIASTMNVGDVDRYIRGHHIPTSPGANDSAIRRAVAKRNRRYKHMSLNSTRSGARGQYAGPRVARRAQKKSFIQRPTFGLQNVGTWNWK